LKKAVEKETGAELKSDDPAFREVIELTVATVEEIQENIRRVDFWRDVSNRESLQKKVYRILRNSGKVAQNKLEKLAARVVDQAKNLHRLLVWGNGSNRD
jgi:hypothetical protein